MRVDNDRR